MMSPPWSPLGSQTEQDFLESHKNADEIVVDLMTGAPHSAIYSRCDGRLRAEPAVYYYPEY